MRRAGYILGWAFLAGCVVTAPFTTSTVWVLGYAGDDRGGAFGLHSGRVGVVYYLRGAPKSGIIAATERGRPTVQNYLLPCAKQGWGRVLVSVPLYVPMGVVGGTMFWKWRSRRRREAAGFSVVMDGAR